MKNYIQPGDVIDITAPTGGFTSGNFYLVGALFGVAANTVAETTVGQLKTEGVFTLPKATGAWTAGDAVYWDNSAKNFTKTTTSNTKAGVAVADAASGDTTGKVRLNGSF